MKKILSGAICLVMLMAFASCGEKPNDNTPQTITNPSAVTTVSTTILSTQTTTEATTQADDGYAKADIAEIAKNIEINGTKISLPCTVGEIASALDGFDNTIKYDQKLEAYCIRNITIQNGNTVVCQCMIKDYDESISPDNNIINKIAITSDSDNFNLAVDGITLKTSIEEIEKKYGKLEKLYVGNYFLRDVSTNASINFIRQTGETIMYGFTIDLR